MMRRAMLAGAVCLLAVMPADAQDGASGPAAGGGSELAVEADKQVATVGDPVELTVRLVVPADAEVRSFDPDAGFAALNILDRSAGEAVEREDGRLQQVFRFRITAYDLEGIEVPALQATVVDAGGVETTLSSSPLNIAIASVLAEDDSEPADIRSPAFMPVSRIWPWLLLAFLLLAAGAWWFWRHRRTDTEEISAAPAAPPRPAHVIAYAELERLLSSGMLERGGVKEFYIELAEILKRYFEARFGIDTFERTSNEVLVELRSARVSIKVMSSTAEFFVGCDLVKFARYHPSSDETRLTVELGYRIIDETKAAPAPPAESQATMSGGTTVEGTAS